LGLPHLLQSLSDEFDGAVIVAVIAVFVVQATVHQIVLMIAVGYEFVTALFVAAEAFDGRALAGIGCADGQRMLIIVAFMGAVQVSIVQIVHMAVVLDASMAAVLAVNMRMVGVYGVGHFRYLLREGGSAFCEARKDRRNAHKPPMDSLSCAKLRLFYYTVRHLIRECFATLF
jgi:hypothetical protein